MATEHQVHVPIIERVKIASLPPLSERERIHVCAMTAIAELQLGADINISEEDDALAQQIVVDGRAPTSYERTKPGLIIKLEALLSEYDYQVVHDAVLLRTYVTNRLILESNDPDPKNRLRALEMLGKISDVGLFADKKEITVTHKSDAELEKELKESLAILLDPKDITDVTEFEEVPPPEPSPEPTADDIDDAIEDL
jgi:hypothetical protein